MTWGWRLLPEIRHLALSTKLIRRLKPTGQVQAKGYATYANV